MKYFGTDGIRGKVGETPITPAFIMHLGWALGQIILNKQSEAKIVIGKDTRSSGDFIEYALTAGLSSCGCTPVLIGNIPTPAIAFLTKYLNAEAGIVISASHNPYQDNGIKIFSGEGKKLSSELENQIEQLLEEKARVTSCDKLTKSQVFPDAENKYVQYCKSTVKDLSLCGIHIAVDAANGACYKVAIDIFKQLGAKVSAIGVSPNGININDNCGSTSPSQLQKLVLKTQADIGIAFDGDGDRVIMVDNNGNIIDGDQLLYVIATSWKDKNLLKGGVVGTVMTNMGVEVSLQKQDINLVRTSVGDKYVNKQLSKLDWILGGESSGHIICKNLASTGDGIIVALQLLKIIVETNKSLAELVKPIQVYPQKLINIPMPREFNISDNPNISKTVSQIQKQLSNSGRVLVRQSGTEPLIRVMIESRDQNQVNKYASELATVIKNETIS
jgi:phosphoglucosamine mutase